jgi:Spy/CpxP family protein refolding chaperone
MKTKMYALLVAIVAVAVIGSITYAGGPGSGGMGGSMGGGQGMMGGHGPGMMGGHMMRDDPNITNPWQKQPQSPYTSYQNRQTETQRLREEIREKRSELSDLYRSEKPDKELIDQKIEELSKLEAKLDQKMSSQY